MAVIHYSEELYHAAGQRETHGLLGKLGLVLESWRLELSHSIATNFASDSIGAKIWDSRPKFSPKAPAIVMPKFR